MRDKKSNGILQFLANVTNVCNLIGREDYNIGWIVLQYSLTKETTIPHSIFCGMKSTDLLIKIKLIISC